MARKQEHELLGLRQKRNNQFSIGADLQRSLLNWTMSKDKRLKMNKISPDLGCHHLQQGHTHIILSREQGTALLERSGIMLILVTIKDTFNLPLGLNLHRGIKRWSSLYPLYPFVKYMTLKRKQRLPFLKYWYIAVGRKSLTQTFKHEVELRATWRTKKTGHLMWGKEWTTWTEKWMRSSWNCPCNFAF